ncbi:YdcH family protein [Cohaesibacter celericrescens]|jgi:uncharacterized protein YdcH (DUF465 family)|uniref:DUF465 domain-containing protein n=1 Tax=Cohaesibacter celericrescens TaxID=2067669 RepID=A0A2N5XLV3_9HYPH|nr:DUF465 domain-containing protein [Cohaesibacter celericrescens]PLW75473.1 hypothetical protein C0081_19205 [Cohaesibacter celericrescens]PLW78880.1 hypothetical protein C0081_01165 [Cohaesibacter celericrescens]
MFYETHKLREEFPDAIEKLQALMIDDEDFLKLAARYTEVNREIIRIEHEEDHASDFYLDNLKRQRLVLKDRVAVKLRN